MMAGFISKFVVTSIAFAYGVFTVILYGLIALKNGTYFTRRTEKESLELELGKYFNPLPRRLPCIAIRGLSII